LFAQLKEKDVNIIQIGDANGPRTCLEAIYEGSVAGRQI